jgi:aminopeptidase YwaD
MNLLRHWVETLRPAVDGERALASVRQLARHHRIQASPGYDRAAAWLAGAAREAGLEVTVEHVPGDGRTSYLGCIMPEGWACEHARAAILGGRGREPIADFENEPLSLVQRSIPASGRFPLVAVADGTQPGDYEGLDVRGRVVLTVGAVQRVHRLAVIERGAAGLLAYGRRLLPPVRTRDHDRDSLAYTSYWWAGDEARGWGFVVSPALADTLLARLAGGEALELEVDIASRRQPTRIPLVTAVLPGTLDAEVLVTAHLCHPRPGANDNASGAAATLEALRSLATCAASGALPARRRTIRALWMPELTGTYAWLGAAGGRAARTLAAINLDMVGEDQEACGSVQLLERAPHFAAGFADELLREVRQLALPGADGGAPAVRTREVPYSGGSDHAVWLDPAVGVPCPMLIQWPDRYYHSSCDSPDRCDPRSLAHAARSAAAYAAFLATAGAPEVQLLAGMLERAARREMLAALDGAQPAREVRAARHRAQRALATLGRFALGEPAGSPLPGAIASAVAGAAEAIDGVYEAEIATEIPAPGAGPLRPPGGRRVPVRGQGGPIVLMRALQAGWAGLPGDLRERGEAFDRETPGGTTTLDLAWYACDGERDLAAIAELLADEGAEMAIADLEAYFEFTARLGVSSWRARQGD